MSLRVADWRRNDPRHRPGEGDDAGACGAAVDGSQGRPEAAKLVIVDEFGSLRMASATKLIAVDGDEFGGLRTASATKLVAVDSNVLTVDRRRST